MAEEINTNLDTTPLPPNNLVAQDPQSAELAGYVRTKTFGRDVRESIARSIELNSTRSKSAEELANETVNVANDLTDRFNQQIGALTEDAEVIDARKSINNITFPNLKLRLDYIEDNLIGQSVNKKFRGAGQNLMFKEAEIGYSFETMLDKLISVNANTVAICPSFWADNATSRITGYKDEPYVSDEIIFNYAKSAKEKGLTVVLKPHVNGENFTSFYSLNPVDYELFINNYSDKLVQLATKCKDYVDIVSITNEMDRQTKTNRDLWLDLINRLRLINPNFKLTNSSRTDDLETNVFLDQLDYIGWNCYLNIGDNLTQTVGEQERNMLMRKDDVNKALSKSVELDKPILITEIGTQAYQTGLSNPESWVHSGEGNYDYQIRYYNVVLRTLLNSERIIGTIIWTAAGIPSGFGFDFLGKEKVELAVKEIYGG